MKRLVLDGCKIAKILADEPLRTDYPEGERFWVAEKHYIHHTFGEDGHRWGPWSGIPLKISPDGSLVCYYAVGFDRSPIAWRSSTCMPHWASRIYVTVKGGFFVPEFQLLD